jgi:hypothetical protein
VFLLLAACLVAESMVKHFDVMLTWIATIFASFAADDELTFLAYRQNLLFVMPAAGGFMGALMYKFADDGLLLANAKLLFSFIFVLGTLFLFILLFVLRRAEKRRRAAWVKTNRVALLRLQLKLATAPTSAESAAVAAAFGGDEGAAAGDGDIALRRIEERRLLVQWQTPWKSIKLGHPVGAGSSAEVWTAELDGSVCACKLLRRELLVPEAMERFRTEILNMINLRHSCIARFIGEPTIAKHATGSPFLADGY